VAESWQRVIPAAFFDRAQAFADQVALRRKEMGLWEQLTWRDYADGVRAVAMALIDLGVEPGEPVGMISDNRVEWLYADLGILSAGAVTCAAYSTSAVEQLTYIFSHSGASVVFAENEEQLDKLLELRDEHPLKRIIVFDDKGLRRFDDPGVELFESFVARGAQLLEERSGEIDQRIAGIAPEDMAILVYTSGTTGPPKGVMLSHESIIWCCSSLESVMTPNPDDEYLSFLPLCHIAERTITVFNQVLNGSVVNFAENLDTVREDLAEVRPHVFFAVPRIWEKLFNAVELKMKDAAWEKRVAYRWALSVGRRMVAHRHAAHRGNDTAPASLRASMALADATVLTHLRKMLGFDRTRVAITGAAPISPEVMEYFQALGIPIVEGYGQTESCAIITVNDAGFPKPGTVGKAIDGLELKIADDGEILARSPGVMLGYYKQPEATAATVDEEGWLHTGDVGELDAEGRLRITDRKKDLIITAGGKNIAPQYIESKLRLSAYIHDAVVIGERRKYISALVILDEDNLVQWAQAERVQFGTYAELAKCADVQKLIDAEVTRINDQLTHVEAIKKFRILSRRHDADEGELTPTLKVRRNMVEQKYATLIEQMY